MRKPFVGIAVICSLALVPSRSGAQVKGLFTKGTADVEVKNRNTASARLEAVRSAKLSALMAVVQEMVPKELFARNQDLVEYRVSQSIDVYVQDYKTLNSEVSGKNMHLELGIVPRKEKLEQALGEWGILFDRLARPKIGIFAIETTKPATDWSAKLRQRLVSLGYSVEMIAARKNKVETKSELGARYDIGLWGTVTQGSDDGVDIELRSAIRQPYQDLPLVRKKLSLSEGIDLVSGIMTSLWLEKVLPAWFQKTGKQQMYQIAVRGMKTFRPYDELRQVFNSGSRGYLSGREVLYSHGSVMFEVSYEGTRDQLVQSLTQMKLPDVKLEWVPSKEGVIQFVAK